MLSAQPRPCLLPTFDPSRAVDREENHSGASPIFRVQSFQPYRQGDEREGVNVFDRNLVEPPEVHDESQFAIRPLHKHDRSSCRRLGRPYEAIRQVRLDVLFYSVSFGADMG